MRRRSQGYYLLFSRFDRRLLDYLVQTLKVSASAVIRNALTSYAHHHPQFSLAGFESLVQNELHDSPEPEQSKKQFLEELQAFRFVRGKTSTETLDPMSVEALEFDGDQDFRRT